MVKLTHLLQIFLLDLLSLVLHHFASSICLSVILWFRRILQVFFDVFLAENEEFIINVELDVSWRMHPHVGFPLLCLLLISGSHTLLDLLTVGLIWVMFSIDANWDHVVKLDAAFEDVLEGHGRAATGDAYEGKTALAQIKSSIMIHNGFWSVCRTHDHLLQYFCNFGRVISLAHQRVK